MVAVTRILPQRSCLALVGGAALLLAMTPMSVAADSTTSTASAQVDALWNQPQGARADSALYIVQSWWDGLTRGAQKDPGQRGLQELAQANQDLLNAYTLLQEQRNDPGPHPVAGIDPLLSGVYSFITGVHVKAPIGSVLGWLNQSVVQLEGRGSADSIVRSLLHDYATEQAAATRDLRSGANGGVDGVLTANAKRQSAMLLKLTDVGAGSLIADVTTPPGQSGAQAKNGGPASQGKSADPHGKAVGHTNGKH